MTATETKEIITSLWRKGLPFAVWKLPGRKGVKLLIQLSGKVRTFNFKQIESVKGFIVVPFESAETHKAYVLEPDLVYDVLPSLDEIKHLNGFGFPAHTVAQNICWDRLTYLNKAEQVIGKLQEKRFKKVVLSRVIERKLSGFDPGVSFDYLNKKYSHSFNYIFYLPSLGSWLGATPEVFLRKAGTYAETMSLAGTKPAGNIRWLPKEIEEQGIVTDFIRSQLEELQIKNYKIDGPQTMIAGSVGHLSTSFKIPVREMEYKTGELISRLHPTPAVCGMPQKNAYQYILQVEDHQRRCYTGFLGPWNLDGSSELFVNLRCAEFDKSKLHIFVGGGLTASSAAEAEWEETEHKSKTLLSVLENF